MVDEVYNGEGSVEITGVEIQFDNIEVYDFASSFTEEDDQPRLSHSYYNYDGNSLICYGYQNAGILDPKSSEGKKYFHFNNEKFSNPKEIFSYLEKEFISSDQVKNDSLYYDPAKCYVFPLYEDQEWDYRAHEGESVIKKTVVGIEDVDVPAGKFDCWKIEWTFPGIDWDLDIEFYEYISCEGLIKRVIEYKNIVVTDEDDNVIGNETSKDEQYLTGFEIIE